MIVADSGKRFNAASAPARPSAAQSPDAALRLAELIDRNAPLFLLTGAGCSTDSGIPDYRGDDGRWKRAEPIRYQAFVRSEAARRRYWARSFVGWPRVAGALPNASHHALAVLEGAGAITQLVTQNVDGLHQKAGSRRVLDLHGRLDLVDCVDCALRLSRRRMQRMLAGLNPDCSPGGPEASAPDGDVLLSEGQQADFRVPPCPACGGVLKPSVVFFGENVPRPRVRRAFEQLDASRGLLVIGSSLQVFSGLRFCLRAAERGQPIALLNRGLTRADGLATMKLDGGCAEVLGGALAHLGYRLPEGSKPRSPSPPGGQTAGAIDSTPEP
ncbi:MAG: NAD-dependent protein deacetylase [Chromatiales bacterium]|jgi:NAD-dependent SIR2 family protein deacetylase